MTTKQLLIAGFVLFAPAVAAAQQPDQQAQQAQQAAQAAVMDQFQLLINKNTVIAALQAQLSDARAAAETAAKAAQAQLADLQKQLAAAQAKSQEPRP